MTRRLLIERNGRRYVPVPLLVFVATLLGIALLFLVLWSVKQRRDPSFRVVSPGDVKQLLPSIAGVTHGDLDGGNRVEVLQNGAYFTSLFRDIASAKETIHFETFLWHEGAIGDQLANLFAQKAREGVEVRVLLDGSGTRPMNDDLLTMMRSAGARVFKFHPISISELGRINNRTHRKIAVIDGRIGYVGGHCIAPEWTGDARNKKEYRDTSVRVLGTVVPRLQAAFSENWLEATGEVPVGPRYYPPEQPAGNSVAHLVYTSPSGSASAVELLYYLAIISAQKELIIQNPYFLPDPEANRAILEAVRRGVKVRVMLPSVEVTDNAIVQHASHRLYAGLLRGGVEIYEYQRSLLHQKVIIVDGVWSCVGSTNFDDRSFEINDEVTLGVSDPAVAQTLRMAFENDLRHSKRRELKEWSEQGMWHRATDALAYLVNEQL